MFGYAAGTRIQTDDQISGYVGFSGVSKYNLKKQVTMSQYFFENNTFGYECTAVESGTNLRVLGKAAHGSSEDTYRACRKSFSGKQHSALKRQGV